MPLVRWHQIPTPIHRAPAIRARQSFPLPILLGCADAKRRSPRVGGVQLRPRSAAKRTKRNHRLCPVYASDLVSCARFPGSERWLWVDPRREREYVTH
eukprot:1580992-Rhodomonas_salina.2